MSAEQAPALTPRAVAELWHCSERHVRNLIRDGKLRAFRLGEKLVRVTATEVERANKLWEAGLPIEAPPLPVAQAVPTRVLSPAPPLPPPTPKVRLIPFGATVYFIRVHGFVKIGWTTCVSLRVRDLETGCPLEMEVLLEIRGGLEMEQNLHEQFAAYRHKREWFRYEGELRAWVEAKIAEAV